MEQEKNRLKEKIRGLEEAAKNAEDEFEEMLYLRVCADCESEIQQIEANEMNANEINQIVPDSDACIINIDNLQDLVSDPYQIEKMNL